MLKKTSYALAGALPLLFLLSAQAAPQSTSGTLYQVSTGNALIGGLYQGAVDFKTLRQEGDFGLGSVKGMNGELIALDGQFYRISPTGKMNTIPDSQTTPYAMVTNFTEGAHFSIENIHSLKQLVDVLNKHLPSRNIPYAIKIKGDFSSLKLRAVRGAKPPYPPFMKLVKNQAIFKLHNRIGEGVGFFTPPYMKELNVPGYHIHFITKDRKTGGHILNCSIPKAEVYLMPMYKVTVAIPHTKEYAESKELNKDNTNLMVSQFGVGVQTH